jgi:glycosyltransferase involved in cell wall biosynthesis
MKYLLLCLIAFFSLLDAKTVKIYTQPIVGMTPWDADSVQTGINGPEEAVVYMSQALANLGYQVVIVGFPPENSRHSDSQANPRYINDSQDDLQPVDIAISWRNPAIATVLKNYAKQVYFWPHDTANQVFSEEFYSGFDDVLWLTEWQRNQWVAVNPGFAKYTKIFGNGINPEQVPPVTERKNPYACIYYANYGKGLEHLLNAWPTIKLMFPLATLDIYFGWQNWGMLTAEKEAFMRTQIDVYEILGVKEHGKVGHKELGEAFAKASFWTFPCTAPEVFCMTALRAQMTGCVPVVMQNTALQETVQHGYNCHDLSEYFGALLTAFRQAEKITLEERKNMQGFVLENYTWKQLAERWDALFIQTTKRT